MSQWVGEGPAPHGGGIDLDAQAAVDFGGGAAIRRGRLGGEEFADQRRTEPMGELTIMFFMAARMRERGGVGECGVVTLRA